VGFRDFCSGLLLGFNGVLQVFTTFNTRNNLSLRQKALFWDPGTVKRRGFIRRGEKDGFNGFNHFYQKQALKPPLDVPGGLFSSSLFFSRDRKEDPKLSPEDPQKCRNDQPPGVYSAVHVRYVSRTGTVAGRVHLQQSREEAYNPTVRAS